MAAGCPASEGEYSTVASPSRRPALAAATSPVPSPSSNSGWVAASVRRIGRVPGTWNTATGGG